MRIYQLFHSLIEKFVPMDKSTQDDLQLEAVKFYQDALDEKVYIDLTNVQTLASNNKDSENIGFEKKPLLKYSIKHTIIGYLDQWYMRYLNALLFIYLVPKIKSFINGDAESEGEEEEEEDSEISNFEQFMKYQRFKKSMT